MPFKDNLVATESADEKVSDTQVEELCPDLPTWTEEEETQVRRQVDFRVVPIVFVLYLLCFLDR